MLRTSVPLVNFILNVLSKELESSYKSEIVFECISSDFIEFDSFHCIEFVWNAKKSEKCKLKKSF
jgi:hypothetical protein